MHTYHRQWEALWTHWLISYSDQEEKHFSEILKLIHTFEKNYSRFQETSLVSKLNLHKSISPSNEMLEMITHWLDAYQKTDGYFSLFVWSILENLWYDKDYSFKEKQSSPSVWNHIAFHNWTLTLWEDTTIDFGGFGKWYLIDKIAMYFKKHGISDRIINGWWDIRIQQDQRDHFGKIWLQHSEKKDILLWEISLLEWAITCSSIHERKRWKNNHLIDPKNGKSIITDVSSIYVYSGTACTADIASTTLSVCWEDNIPLYAQKLWVEYIIVLQDQKIVHSKNFPGIELFK